MARIRTIKPDFFQHEGLYELEKETGLPMRLAFAGIWTCCDREGRFKWRPRQLKLQVLPYDDLDFSRVLDALATRGFLVKYAIKDEIFGSIPSWKRHQVINNKESASEIPPPTQAAQIQSVDACLTREAREGDACGTRDVRKGRERKEGKEGEGAPDASLEISPTPDDLPAVTLASGMIEVLCIPSNPRLVHQVTACIEAKARESGMSFAEAHDHIRAAALRAKSSDDPPNTWLFWFQDARYDKAVNAPKRKANPYGEAEPRSPNDLPVNVLVEREARRAANGD